MSERFNTIRVTLLKKLHFFMWPVKTKKWFEFSGMMMMAMTMVVVVVWAKQSGNVLAGMPGGSWHRWSTLSDMFDQIRLTYPPTNGIFLTMAKYLFPTTEVFCPTNANILGPQSKICSRRFNFCQICSPRLAKVGLPRIIFSQQKILFSKAGQKYCVGHTEEKYMSDMLKLISHK